MVPVTAPRETQSPKPCRRAFTKPTRRRNPQDVSGWYVLGHVMFLAGCAMAVVFLMEALAIALYLSTGRLYAVLVLIVWGLCWLMAGSCFEQDRRTR